MTGTDDAPAEMFVVVWSWGPTEIQVLKDVDKVVQRVERGATELEYVLY